MAATPKTLAAAQGHGLAAWQPSFWFLGLFQQLNGSPGLPVLAHRAWIALALVTCITALAYVLSYFRTLAKNRRRARHPCPAPAPQDRLPRFGNELENRHRSVQRPRCSRSRQHRIILAFYLGMGFALNMLFLAQNAEATPEGTHVVGPRCQRAITGFEYCHDVVSR